MSLFTFPEANFLILWDCQIKFSLWEHLLSPCMTEVLKKNDGERIMMNLCLIERILWKSHSVFLPWSKDKLSLQGGVQKILGHFHNRRSLQRQVCIRHSLLLFRSLMPVTEVVLIFTSLVFGPETEAERGPFMVEVPLPRILALTGASSASSRIK